jgi:hypothetical protein
MYILNFKFEKLKNSRVVFNCLLLLLLLFTSHQTTQAFTHGATYEMDGKVNTPGATYEAGGIKGSGSMVDIRDIPIVPPEEPDEAIVSVNRVPSTSSYQIRTRNGLFSSTVLSNDLKESIEKLMTSIAELNFNSPLKKDEAFDRLPSSNADVLNLNSPIPDFWHLF